MIKEIECVGENLEGFILHGEQVPAYACFSGDPDTKKCDRKTIEHYHKGKRLAEQFDKGKDFLESLSSHTKKCEKCLENMDKLKAKYKGLEKKEIEKLNNTEMKNLKYFEIL